MIGVEPRALAAGAIPPSVIANPPREWGKDASPTSYPDPDIIVVDPVFKDSLVGITQIRRLWDKGLCLEGPAWSSQGNYLIFSDVQANTQYRYLWEIGEVTITRPDSRNNHGNTFDFEARQIIEQDHYRRIIGRKHDGSYMLLADKFGEKPFNSPNDLAVHPDGSVWFTDPSYGDTLSEGHPDVLGGPSNSGHQSPFIGDDHPELITGQKRELPTNCYRIDKSSKIDTVISESELPDPNGICFSLDFKAVYVASTSKEPGLKVARGKSVIYAFDVNGSMVSNQRLFTNMVVDSVKCSSYGMNADVEGNLWCESSGPLGYGGVMVFSPTGKLLERMRLPQLCSNLTFGGRKRTILFMMCGQSLCTLQVQTQGAAPS
ncbi:SMP-30/gluconolactonase/LRE family protein [Ameyamaea chiangmaiensis]|uniref:SMP-30/gluconolactonase/LRE family protein n=2 Tax=Ameyamaea chiangmaiensis TaxID=442969 RepID=A0A850P7A5_9PROT|nr:SMP-30/gluconolactonase/LRE family protein [Ameyamaea chiangmaiensis]NVN39818.1 SMP-30/gluconolactonase/LRE family protein [Ameyamaea chiangmaiensis]